MTTFSTLAGQAAAGAIPAPQEDPRARLETLRKKRRLTELRAKAAGETPQTDPNAVISGRVAPQQSTLARPGSTQPVKQLPRGFQHAYDPLAPGGEGMRPIPEYQAQQEEPGNAASRWIENQNTRLGPLNAIAEPLQAAAAFTARDPVGAANMAAEFISPMTGFSEGYQGFDQAGRAALRGDAGEAGMQALRGVTGYASTALDLSPAGMMSKGATGTTKRALSEFDDAMRTQAMPPAQARAPSAAPSAPVVAPNAPPPGAGQQAGAALNAAPVAQAAPSIQLAKSDAKIIGRLLRAGGVPRNDVDGLLTGLVQAYQGSNQSRTRLALFAEEYLPQVLPQPVADEVVTKLRAFGNERLAATGPGDASRAIIQRNIGELRGSQEDYLTGVFENELRSQSLFNTKGRVKGDKTENAKVAYKTAISEGDALLNSGKAKPEAVAARDGLLMRMGQPSYFKRIPDELIVKAENDPDVGGLWEYIHTRPLEAAHWLQSEFGRMERLGGDNAGLYKQMRRQLLNPLEDAVPGYRGTRMKHGDLFGQEIAVKFGDDLFTVGKNLLRTEEKAADYKRLSSAQKAVAEKSIRDVLKNEFRKSKTATGSVDPATGRPLDTRAAFMTQIQKDGTLDALERILGDKGKRIADAIRREAQLNDRLPAYGSDTAKNLAEQRAARDAVQSPLNRMVGDAGDRTGWLPSMAIDAGMMMTGTSPVPLLTAAKIGSKVVDKFGNPSPRALASATETLYGKPPPAAVASTGGRSGPSGPAPKRAPPQRVASTPELLDSLLKQYDVMDHGRTPAASDKLMKRIVRVRADLEKQRTAPAGGNALTAAPDNAFADPQTGNALTRGVEPPNTNAFDTPPDKMGYGDTKQNVGPQTREAAARYFAADPARADQPLSVIARDLNVNMRSADALRTEARGGSRPRSRPRQNAFADMTLTNPAVQGGVGAAAGGVFAPDMDGDGQVSLDERFQSAGLGAVGSIMAGGLLRGVAPRGVDDMAVNGARGAVRRAPVEVTDDVLMAASERLGPEQFEVWKAATMGRNRDGLPLTNDEIADLINEARPDATMTRETVGVHLSQARKKGFDVPNAPNGALSDDTLKLIELSAQGLRPKDIAERLGKTKTTVGALRSQHKAAIEARRAELQQAAPQASAAADLSQYSEGTRQAIELAAMDYPISRIARTLGFEPQNVERILAQLKPAIDARKADLDAIRAMRINRSTFGGVNAKTAQLTSGQLDELEASLKAKGLQGDELRRKLYDDTYDAIGQGWWRGTDGKWRFEIDDSGSGFRVDRLPATPGRIAQAKQRFTEVTGEPGIRFMNPQFVQESDDALRWVDANPVNNTTNLGNVLEHDDLFGAYPDSRFMQVGEETNPSLNGSFNTLTEEMRIRSRSPMLGRNDPGPAEMRSTTLHENQHVVQAREGFAQGGNPTQQRAVLEQERSQSIAATYDEMRSILDQTDRNVYEAWSELVRARVVSDFDRADQVENFLAASDEGKRLLDLDWKARSAAAGTVDEAKAYEAYRRLAGEVEARNVQTRRDFTPDQRRAQAPWETQDTPDDQQIVRFGQSGPQMSANAPRGSIVSKMQKSGDMAVNPSADELRALMRPQGNMLNGARSRGRSLRLLLNSETGDMYAWPAEEVWHFDVARDLNLNAPTTFRATLDPGERLENVSWKDWSDQDVGSTLDKKFRQGEAAGREPTDIYMDLTTDEIAADMKLRGMTGPSRGMQDYPYRREKAMQGVERDPETGNVSWKTRSGKLAQLMPSGMGGAELALDGFNAKVSRAPAGGTAEARETFEKAFSVMEREAIRRNEPVYVITPTRNPLPPEKQALRGSDTTRGRERLYLGLLQRLGPPRGYIAAIPASGEVLEDAPRIALLRTDYFEDLVSSGRMNPQDFTLFMPRRGTQPEPEWRRRIGLFGAPAAVGAGAAATPFLGGEAEAQGRPSMALTDVARAALEEQLPARIVASNRAAAASNRAGVAQDAGTYERLGNALRSIPRAPPVRYARTVDPLSEYDYSRQFDPSYAGYRGRDGDGVGGRK